MMEQTGITLENRIRLLAFDQQEYESAKAALASKRAQFNEENADLITLINEMSATVDQEKQVIRELALVEFTATGVKKLGGGVGIRENKRAVYDPEAARTWATEKRPDLIVLDAKEYEKVLKSAGRDPSMPGDIVIEVSATIPTDLSAYLEE